MKPIGLIAAALISALAITSVHAKDFTSADLNRRTIERRGVDAVNWSLALVSEDAVKRAASSA